MPAWSPLPLRLLPAGTCAANPPVPDAPRLLVRKARSARGRVPERGLGLWSLASAHRGTPPPRLRSSRVEQPPLKRPGRVRFPPEVLAVHSAVAQRQSTRLLT